MNILLSEHTFLVISFVLAVWLLYKFAYKKLNTQIEKSINDIRGAITNNEQLRQNAEEEIKRLSSELVSLEDSAMAEETKARQEAKIIGDNNNEKIAKIIFEKNREYENAKSVLERNFLKKKKKEYIKNITHKIKERLEISAKDKDFQGKVIEGSLNMIEEYIARSK